MYWNLRNRKGRFWAGQGTQSHPSHKRLLLPSWMPEVARVI